MRTIIIDNKDSFTYNIYQLVATLTDCDPIVLSNENDWAEIEKIPHNNIIISPGPGNPENVLDTGCSVDAILHSVHPLLGVCLGHQCIVFVNNGMITKAPEPYHGRVSTVNHSGNWLFKDIPPKFKVTRYHSLIAADPIPDNLEKIASTDDGMTMAIAHKEKPQWGIQFHPESICSQYGENIIKNFLNYTNFFDFKNQFNCHVRSKKKISIINHAS